MDHSSLGTQDGSYREHTHARSSHFSHGLAQRPLAPPVHAGDALRVGILWLVLTLAFELIAGHYLFRRSWPSLWAEYDLSRGRIWVLVPLVTFLAPLLAGYLRGLFR